MTGTAALILAAGGSSRLGRPKQLVNWEGEPLVRRAAQTALDAGCHPVAVALGAMAETCAEPLASLPVTLIRNQEWQRGMGSSIQAGVAILSALDPKPTAVALLLCDQPALHPGLLRQLHSRLQQRGITIAACTYAGAIGTPALFSSIYFPELLALDPEKGAKTILSRHRESVGLVEFPAGVLDIDTEADLTRALDGILPQ